ncbi:MAG TPA: hypothetical protein VMT19_05855 [Thermoanaerobaculaceae bacterium]|nr:hypothetical protein [Thermoanaerobaculaceae bacterium]
MRHIRFAIVSVLAAASASAGIREVELALPVRSKLALTGHERLYVGPFVRERKGDEKAQELAFDVAAEFERYIRKLLRKETKYVLLAPIDGIRLPTTDPLRLAKDDEFWRDVGTRSGADYIVAGSIDFQVQDRSGLKTEEYESPIDGRKYYRQRMVEQTGFSYDILLNVYDARTGSLVFSQPLKDFQEKPERNFDEFTGMFSNLFALENQLIGVFVPRTVKTKRVLFTP